MKATEIPVMEFTEFEDAMVQERNALAKKAHKQLGYKLLAQTINPAANLLAALKKLDIKPLSRLGVEQYKISKEKVFIRASSIRLAAYWILVAPLAITAPIALYWYIHTTPFPNTFSGELSMQYDPPFWLAASFVALAITAATVVGTLCNATWGAGKHETPRFVQHWKRYPIAEYAGAIPEFALAKALQIKELCLTADFYIDQLVTEVDRQDAERIRDNQERIVRMRDPFLVVVTKDETYYIEVWDEKDYESKL